MRFEFCDMGNKPLKRRSEVTTLSYRRRSTESSSTSSRRSLLRVSSSRINVREWSPFPTDIAIITKHDGNTLVVADYTNKVIKFFSPSRNHELPIEGIPYRMSKVDNESLAVTFPLSLEIKIVSVRDMSVTNVINTMKMYVGITALPRVKHTLVVGTHRQEPGFVDVIDMGGHVLKSFTYDRYDNAMFMAPTFLCSTPAGDILVSDHSMHSLTCISQKGDLKWRHQPHKGDNFLEDPVAVVCSENEVIFLVDRLKKCVFSFATNGWCFGPVIQMDSDNNEPFSMCTDRSKTIYIGFDDGAIHVYPDGVESTIKTVIELPKTGRVT